MDSGPSKLKMASIYRLDPNADPDSAHFALGDDSGAARRTWRKVALAVGLLIFGSVLLFTGVGLYVTGKEGGVPLLCIGSLAFIPGAYHTRIAYLAWKGYQGYSLNSIPDV